MRAGDVVFTPENITTLRKAGFSRQGIHAWLKGVCNPTVKHVKVAATALGWTMGQFLDVLDNTRRKRVAVATMRERNKRKRERRRMLKRKKEAVQ